MQFVTLGLRHLRREVREVPAFEVEEFFQFSTEDADYRGTRDLHQSHRQPSGQQFEEMQAVADGRIPISSHPITCPSTRSRVMSG